MRTLGLRGSELAHSDNPSVMALRETAMTAPFTQGSRGCSRTSGFFDGSRKYQGIAMPVRALAPNDMQFFDLGGCGSSEYPAKLETFQRSAQNGIPWIVEKAENHFLRQKGLDFLRKLL